VAELILWLGMQWTQAQWNAIESSARRTLGPEIRREHEQLRRVFEEAWRLHAERMKR